MRLPFTIFEAFEWIDKEEGIFRRDPTEDNPTGLYRRVDCPRCSGYGEDQEYGACYKCGKTGVLDIPQIEGIGNQTMDAYDPWEGEGNYYYPSEYSQYGGDEGDIEDEEYANQPLDPQPEIKPPAPIDPNDIPF